MKAVAVFPKGREVKVIDVRAEERKMTLSLRQARQEAESRRERQHVDEYQSQYAAPEPRFTIGDAIRARRRSSDDDDDEE